MNAALVVLLPIIMLGIVGVFCFVGCTWFDGIRLAFTQYSDLVVLRDKAIVAGYWPLDEASDETIMGVPQAKDHGPNGIDGRYVDMNTLSKVYPSSPPIFPFPLVPNIPMPPIGTLVGSADATGALDLNQPGLVKGDAKQPANDFHNITTCMVVNGGYVDVPFDQLLNPPSFTLEAWVQVGWTINDPKAWRAVLDARAQDPICKGFAIFASVDDDQSGYHWAVMVGNGGMGLAGFSVLTDQGPQIALLDSNPPPEAPPLAPVYLAVIYNGTTLTLFMDGKQSAQTTGTQSYVPNTSSSLYIGAGAPYVPKRQVASSMSGGPLFPFNGAIQDVAIYNVALDASDIPIHFKHGMDA